MSAALLVCVDGEDIAVCAAGSDIVVEMRHPRRLLRQAGSIVRGYRILRATASRLNDYGLSLTLSQGGVPFARLGAGTRTSLVARLGGLRHIALIPKKKPS